MANELNIESSASRELLGLAMRNSSRSVPLQLLAVVIMVAFGFSVKADTAAWAVVVLGLSVAAWRISVSKRFMGKSDITEKQIIQITRELEGNPALAGILWAVCA